MTQGAIPPSARFNRRDLLWAASLAALGLGLYGRTLAPGLLPGDSGEFQVLAFQVGLAHTTGYPVYMLLAKLLVTLIPLRDVAYRVNLFSAAMGALTLASVYLAGRTLLWSRWAASYAALTLMVSYTFWSQAVIAEVYTPGACFVALVLAMTLWWYTTGRPWALFLAGLCGGLGLGVHASVGLMAPAMGLFLWLSRRRWPKWWWPAFMGAAAGFALYLAAFLAVDMHAPPANIFRAAYGPSRSFWGLTETDLANPWKRIWFVGTAGQWRSAAFADPGRLMPERLTQFVRGLPREFAWPALGLAVLGLVALSWRDWRLGVLFLSALVIQLGFYFNYDAWDIYVFYIPSYLLLALLAGAGLNALLQFIERWLWTRVSTLPVGVAVLMIVLSVWPMLAPYRGALREGKVPFAGEQAYPYDHHVDTLRYTAMTIASQLEPNAIVFADWYWLYPYYYAAHIELGRTDLQFVEMAPRNDRGGLASSVVEFIREEIDARPIYFTQRMQAMERAGFRLTPVLVGSVQFYRVERRSP
ncbi:MAG: DUF2723 domain-containing protein [Anaerolineae bacterium]|nr:DUF2723 domain-containing protein [Anaerolineae bacterium]MDW8100061.1 DUF2723 domain-containing protein [Anaerolineae bacterium]